MCHFQKNKNYISFIIELIDQKSNFSICAEKTDSTVQVSLSFPCFSEPNPETSANNNTPATTTAADANESVVWRASATGAALAGDDVESQKRKCYQQQQHCPVAWRHRVAGGGADDRRWDGHWTGAAAMSGDHWWLLPLLPAAGSNATVGGDCCSSWSGSRAPCQSNWKRASGRPISPFSARETNVELARLQI